ncbi:uncharacterized protein BBA_03890 [Beauveria bassiana ARSEF 2860]|uniref:Aminoglycoside phosphotransferase domain-containing protein n=1 Tax=Beauveria bassiana (strain ARSEF 2860) TaxID=655819 RepID=J5JYT7_BEAB2|nr:uncharacterized protein BBA_03890 [Beauveria bassiana ARSEF 2860]EJP67316.1 hypothetical protein BBA_03890 [Beauveria bassiana ARSEF 2860]
MAEAAMQRYVYEHADPRIVRIPQVFDAFTITEPDGASVTYIVMEMSRAAILEHTAIRHVWDLPLPPNAAIGPLGHERPVDSFFSDIGSDRAFNNAIELQDWINNKLNDAGRSDRVILEGERLSICHCDLTPFNVKMCEPIAIIDWGFAGIYPRAFEEFAILNQGMAFANTLCRQLFGPKPSKHMRAMALAARFHMFGC